MVKCIQMVQVYLCLVSFSWPTRVTLPVLDVKIIPCRVDSLTDIQQKDWGQSSFKGGLWNLIVLVPDNCLSFYL